MLTATGFVAGPTNQGCTPLHSWDPSPRKCLNEGGQVCLPPCLLKEWRQKTGESLARTHLRAPAAPRGSQAPPAQGRRAGSQVSQRILGLQTGWSLVKDTYQISIPDVSTLSRNSDPPLQDKHLSPRTTSSRMRCRCFTQFPKYFDM